MPTVIKREGQKFVDEAILVRPLPLAASVAAAFGQRPKTPIVIGHERIKLRWMKPDGQGGLVPR